MKRASVLVLVLAFIAYLVVPFFRHTEGQGGALYDCYLMGNRHDADNFADGLVAALKTKGFASSGGPGETFGGIVPTDGVLTWYRGTYRGSLPLYVKLYRDGPQKNCFHLEYSWYERRFSSVRDRMDKATGALSVVLREWSENHGAGDSYVHK